MNVMRAACGRPLCFEGGKRKAMRLFVRILVLSVLTCGVLGSVCHADSTKAIQIRRLTIESDNLPQRYRRQVERDFEGSSYEGASYSVAEEVGERIRAALRDLGYFEAAADEPKMSFVASGRRRLVADVWVRVKEGAQYRLGEIEFKNAKLFPAARMRAAFNLQEGDLYNATKFGAGLEHLMRLYVNAGYVNFVEIPEPITDESRHVIDWTIDVDEGWAFDFGRLILDGPEPYAGAGSALLASWNTLEGKRYSPDLLQQWLMTNRAYWQKSLGGSDPTNSLPNPDSHVVNVRLSFPGDPTSN